MQLQEVLEEIKKHEVESIILFGSYARGETGEDIDILVVADKPLSFDFGEAYHVMVILKNEIENNSRRFKYSIKRDGIVVYGTNPFASVEIGEPTLENTHGYLDDASELIKKGVRENVARYLRTAGEQVLHAVEEVTRYLLERENYPIPNNLPETLKYLKEIDEKEPSAKGIANLYRELSEKFHVDVWHKGYTPGSEEILSFQDSAKSLVEKIESKT